MLACGDCSKADEELVLWDSVSSVLRRALLDVLLMQTVLSWFEPEQN